MDGMGWSVKQEKLQTDIPERKISPLEVKREAVKNAMDVELVNLLKDWRMRLDSTSPCLCGWSSQLRVIFRNRMAWNELTELNWTRRLVIP